jgi:N6-adenosine-specific RNA methylase IME4
MQYHDVANIFPMSAPEDYNSLKDSISKDGLLEAIWIYDNKIIDGRNRYKACLELKISPRYRQYDGEPDKLVDFVLGLNLSRRHLTPSEKACVAVEALGYYEKQAKERQLAGKKIDLTEKFPQGGGKGEAREQVAQIFGVNSRYVSDAKRIAKEDETIFNQIKQGRINISEGKEIMRLPNEQRQLILQKLDADVSKRMRDIRSDVVKETAKKVEPITGKFQIIYADPPWQYNNFQGLRNGGVASARYNTMTMDELKALSIPDIADDNCALFMWSTYPMLPQAIDLIKIWGFEYITVAFTWVKLNPSGEGYYSGMGGFYTNANAEIVLLGKRGKIQRVNTKVKQLVVAPVQEHSKKPDEVRQRIVELLGDLPRVELFARQPSEGWSSWGNQL